MNPDLIYVKYGLLRPKYYSQKPKERFDKSNLPRKEVTYREFVNTISIASSMVKRKLLGARLLLCCCCVVGRSELVFSAGTSRRWGPLFRLFPLVLENCPGAVFFDRRALFASTGVVEGCKNLPKAVIVSTDQPARAIGLLCVGPRKADEITTALGRFCTPRRVPRGRVWL